MNDDARAHTLNRVIRPVATTLLATMLGGCSLFGIRTAEQADYVVVDNFDGIELRDYAAHVTVETTVEAAFEDAGDRAFGKLFGYISGENRARAAIEMTAPVITREAAGETIAMTAPVVATPAASGWTYAFVLPARFTPENAPLPLRDDVRLGHNEPRRVAVLRFAGAWSEAAFGENLARLRGWIEGQGLETASAPRFAAYDPPWTIPFLRRNEILIDVKS